MRYSFRNYFFLFRPMENLIKENRKTVTFQEDEKLTRTTNLEEDILKLIP